MFHKVLVANRGEIAVRILRTCRALGIASVAVYSDADRGALHVQRADEALHIGAAAPSASYLAGHTIIEAAQRSGADAIHPGYGFLSENADFAEACAAGGLTFIGPPPAAMRLMGDKNAARRLARDQGVPVLPGSSGDRPDDGTLQACAADIGYPVMLKAAAGGGGRGMRLVEGPDAMARALAGARREALAAFGDERLLLERAVVGGRHVEVQVLADAHGAAIHLGERDCSIQRRFQKVIEEAPAPAISPELRARLADSALRLVREAQYRNAGTVEFLLDRDDGFFFLEMNSRLQVEHGVTELITGLDLVALQLRIAAGEPLAIAQEDVAYRGHAIECRVYAEDPSRGYAPSPGRLRRFAPPTGDGIRNDVGVAAGSAVPADYDPLLAKLLVHAPTRSDAIDRCARALDAYVVDGVRTNLGLLRAVMALPAFQRGGAELTTLSATPPDALAPQLPDAALLAAAADSLLPRAAAGPRDAWDAVGAWRNAGPSTIRYEYHGYPVEAIARSIAGRTDEWEIEIGGRSARVRAERGEGGAIAVTCDGVRRAWTAAAAGAALTLEASDGHRYVLALPGGGERGGVAAAPAGARGAAVLRAPMHGEVAEVLVAVGDQVRARQALIVLVAMKMEHVIEAAVEGVVGKVHCSPGEQVAEGKVLIELAARATQAPEE